MVLLPRVNINITDEMKKYFEQLSKDTGASQSALMSLYLKEYIDQKEAMKMMPELLKQFNVLNTKK